jgi:DNA-binding transcriptional regulator YiaG
MTLTAHNENWDMEGELTVRGLSGKAFDTLEDELSRRLGGRCTLSIGPPQEAALLEGANVGACLRTFCTDWGMSEDDIVAKSGLTLKTIRACINGKDVVRDYTRKTLAATLNRIVQRPTVGEFIRYRRVQTHYQVKYAAMALGVSEQTVTAWEQDEEEVPENKRWAVMNLYGIKDNLWGQSTPTVLDVMAPVSATSPAPWGAKSKELAEA